MCFPCAYPAVLNKAGTCVQGGGFPERDFHGIWKSADGKWPSIRLLSLLAIPPKNKSIRISRNYVLFRFFHIPHFSHYVFDWCNAHPIPFSVLCSADMLSLNFRWRGCKHRQDIVSTFPLLSFYHKNHACAVYPNIGKNIFFKDFCFIYGTVKGWLWQGFVICCL